MERSKRGLVFWVLLLVSVVLPSTVLATKQLYHAPLTDPARNGVGAAIIGIKPPNIFEYMASTFSRPDQTIQAVWLSPTDGAWVLPLCTNGGPTQDDCTYDETGNLDIEGTITPTMLMYANVTGPQFLNALQGGVLRMHLSEGSSGLFYRIF